MEASGIRAGDIIKCDVRGYEFLALVSKAVHHNRTLDKRVIEIEPVTPKAYVPTTFVTPRQITDHWRKSRRKGKQ